MQSDARSASVLARGSALGAQDPRLRARQRLLEERLGLLGAPVEVLARGALHVEREAELEVGRPVGLAEEVDAGAGVRRGGAVSRGGLGLAAGAQVEAREVFALFVFGDPARALGQVAHDL